MAKKDNASFEGGKQRTPVRIKELADAVTVLEAHHYIKSYTSLAQIGLSDSDFGNTANDLLSNLSAINAAVPAGTSFIMQLNAGASTNGNLRMSLFNKIYADVGIIPSSMGGGATILIRRGTDTLSSLLVDVVYESAAMENYMFSTVYNKDADGTERVNAFVVTKSRYGFLEKSGGTLAGRLIIRPGVNWSQIQFGDSSGVSNHKVHGYTSTDGTESAVQLEANRDGTDKNRSVFTLRSKHDGTVPANAVAFSNYVDNKATVYILYGEHNKDSIVLGTAIKMTPAGETTRSREVIRLYADSDAASNYGDILVIGAAGDTYIGSGESATNLYNAIGATASENMYVCADSNLYLYAACNTIANRKGLCLSSGAFNPTANGGMALGSASYRWGQIYSTAATISTSDRNEKHDVRDLNPESAKCLILGLRPVSYKFNDGTSGRTHSGLIAQDVEELLRELEIPSKDCAAFIKSPLEKLNRKTGQYDPVTDEEGNPKYRYGLRYEEFIAPLIKTVQEQQKEIDRLEERIRKLEERWEG